MVTHRLGWLDPVFVGLSWLGSYGLVWLALAALGAAVWRRPQLLLLVGAADLAAEFGSLGLRHAIGRPRPPLRFPDPEPLVGVSSTPSFPSGHATTSFACAVLLASAAPRLAVPLIGLAAAISLSRVYVGVHYPLDVVGGAALGIVLATALRLLAGGRRRSPRARRAG